jgi:hypothetical protein
MEHLIQEFGAWMPLGHQPDFASYRYAIGRGADSEDRRVLGLVLLLLLYAFYWVFGRFISVIRWALDRIAYALGVILFSAAVVSGVFSTTSELPVTFTPTCPEILKSGAEIGGDHARYLPWFWRALPCQLKWLTHLVASPQLGR